MHFWARGQIRRVLRLRLRKLSSVSEAGVVREMFEQLSECFEAACGSADANDRKIGG
jgi:hypothetical protein